MLSNTLKNLKENHSVIKRKIAELFKRLHPERLKHRTARKTGSDRPSLKGTKAMPPARKILVGCGWALLAVIILAVWKPFASPRGDLENTVIQAEIEKTKSIEMGERERKQALHLARGEALFKSENFAEALSRLQAALEFDPQNERALELVQLCQVGMEQETQITRAQQEKEKKREQHLYALLEQANALSQQGDFRKARTVIMVARKLAPADERVTAQDDQIEVQLKAEAAKAKAEVQNRQKLLTQVRFRYAQGKKYYDEGNYGAALKELERVLEAGVASNETTKARVIFPQLESIVKANALEKYDKGLACYKRGEYDRALEFFQKALEDYPEHADAQRHMDKLVEVLSLKAKNLYREGVVYEGIGQTDKAIKKWKQTVKTVPLESNTYYKKANRKLQTSE